MMTRALFHEQKKKNRKNEWHWIQHQGKVKGRLFIYFFVASRSNKLRTLLFRYLIKNFKMLKLGTLCKYYYSKNLAITWELLKRFSLFRKSNSKDDRWVPCYCEYPARIKILFIIMHNAGTFSHVNHEPKEKTHFRSSADVTSPATYSPAGPLYFRFLFRQQRKLFEKD